MLRRFLVALLVLALPIQAALASSRLLCAAMTHDAPASAVAHEVAHHDASSHDHAQHHDTAPAQHDHDRGHGNAGCKLCAACTVTAATPPQATALAPVEAASARFPPLDAAVPRIGTRGPERPPRTV